MFSTLLWLAAVPIAVESAGCPNRAEIESALEPLLPPAATGAPPTETARVERRADGVRITLRRDDGSVVGERTIPATEGCGELANAVAVVLATWWTDVHPEYVVRAPAEATAARGTPAPLPAVPAARRTVVEVSLGGGGSVADGDWEALGALSAMVARGRLGLRATASLGGTRELELGEGQARWVRWPVTLAPVVRVGQGRWGADLFAGAAIAWLRASGRGFPVDRTRDAAAFGGTAGVRAGTRGALAPWIEVGALLWPRREEILEAVAGGAAALPQVELGVTVGFSLIR